MRVAAIDIGTNTLLLLIAERRGGRLVAVEDHCRFGRLGEGLDASGALHPDAIARSLAICEEFGGRLRAAGVDRVRAIGTQALREARNATAFVGPAEAALGAPIETISGDQEAALVYRSVARAFPDLAAGELVVVDVGGGSTEIIVGRGGAATWQTSLPIGAVRLSERHLRGDPPAPAEAAALIAAIDGAIAGLDLPRGAAVVGTAGTATTLATVAQRLERYDAARVQGYRVDAGEVDRLVARFLELDVATKRRLPGLEPARADVIAGGAAILARLLHRIGARELVVSDRGVRWGVAHDLDEAGAAVSGS
jgi:exopolyphosphatase/guanosine-5'-triphosphate,3'-diphosphate pyrophosphatase